MLGLRHRRQPAQWAFDTQRGFTWFHKASGTEVSVLPGLLLNTTNPATNYRSGNEFHLDFMVNQFVAKDIAIGVQVYWYKQIDGDSGTGAKFGPFMGESFGLGPAVLWVPEQLGGRYVVILKWVHDISNSNRLNGDWARWRCPGGSEEARVPLLDLFAWIVLLILVASGAAIIFIAGSLPCRSRR